MKRPFLQVISLIVLFILQNLNFAYALDLFKTGQINCYSTTGASISCKGTGQDGHIQAGVSWVSPRFTVNADNTITDNLTGLTWAKNAQTPTFGSCTGGIKTWQSALDYVSCLNANNYLGYSDWRLPNINEIQSLLHVGQASSNTWLNTFGFDFPTGSPSYWSSTTTADNTSKAFSIYMDTGTFTADPKNDASYESDVIPVRGNSNKIIATGQTISYYTGDDGENQKGLISPANRFVVYPSGIVLDGFTGMMWVKNARLDYATCGLYQMTAKTSWQQALDNITCLNKNNFLGYSDWRLPNKNELSSLINYGSASPAFPLGHPFNNVASDFYWTSTTKVKGTPNTAYYFDLKNGLVNIYTKSSNIGYLLPVRGGSVSAFSFTPPIDFSGSSDNISTFDFADVRTLDNLSVGDTRPDLIISDTASNLKIFAGQGTDNASFTAVDSYTLTEPLKDLTALSLKSNGTMDIVGVGESDLTIVYDNAMATTIVDGYTSFYADFIATGDYDRDRLADLLIVRQGDPHMYLLKNMEGTFSSSQAMDITSGIGPYKALFADLNRDGILDIVAVFSCFNGICYNKTQVFYGNGSSFTPGFYASLSSMPTDVKVADINNDGKPDIIVTLSEDNSTGIFINDNGTTFSYVQYPVGASPSSLVVADFNSDGLADIATADTASGTVTLLRNKGNALFEKAMVIDVGGSPTLLRVADINSDGMMDFAVMDNASSVLKIFMNQTPKSPFSVFDKSQATAGISNSIPTGIISGDFNRDGKLDIALANNAVNDLSVFTNRGNAQFNTPVSTTVTVGQDNFVFGDFNKDGILDIAFISQADNSTHILHGLDNGSFTLVQTIAFFSTPTSIAYGGYFLNADGIADMAITFDNRSIILLAGYDNGTFYNFDERDVDVNFNALSVLIGDFNKSNISDIVVSLPGASKIKIFLEADDGYETSLPTGAYVEDMKAGDFDRDGKLDLLVTALSGSQVKTYFLQGHDNRSFTVHEIALDGYKKLAVADFNGDSILDFAGIKSSQGQYSYADIYYGVGDGTFNHTQTVSFMSTIVLSDITAGDFNADGKVDLAVSHYQSAGLHGFTVLINGADTSPEPFLFNPKTNATANTTYFSDNITITGINTQAPVSIVSGEYSINGGAYTSSVGYVQNGDIITVKLTTGADPNTPYSAILNVGGYITSFTVTTEPTPAVITPLISSVNFGNVIANTSRLWNITIANTGQQSTTIDNITIIGSLAFNIHKDFCTGIQLAEGQKCSVWVKFMTDNSTAQNATLQINNANSVALSGKAVKPQFIRAKAWGDGNFGRLGDNTTEDKLYPVDVLEIDNLMAILGGREHSLALRADGTVWAWGNNYYGQLGDNTTTNRLTPVQVVGLDNVTAIATGDAHSLALRFDGTVWAWGNNSYGQLGDNTTTERYTPTQVVGLDNVTAIYTGLNHSFAIKADGTVWAWGSNGYGQLGDGTYYNSYEPKQIGLDNVSMILGGNYYSLALKYDGTVWAWGSNDYGQLGDSTTTNRLTPVQVVGLDNVTAIAAGDAHSLALRSDGTVWAWGYNSYGQVGDNTTTNKLLPVHVVGLNNVVSVSSFGMHSLALKADGTVWAWGANASGQLGDNTTIDKLLPVQTEGISRVAQVSSGFSHSLSLQNAGYQLSVIKMGVGQGSVSANQTGFVWAGYSGSGTFWEGSEITLTATADNGSAFVSWAGCDNQTGNVCTVLMTQDKTLTVTFDTLPTVNLTVTKSGSGSVIATGCTLNWIGNTGTCSVDNATTITLSANANTGYSFVGWSVGTGSASICTGADNCTFNITDNSSLTATFTLNQYTITTSASPVAGGSVVCSPNPVTHGFTSTCTVTTNVGYTLQGFGETGACGGILSGDTYTTNPITANCNVEALYLQIINGTCGSAHNQTFTSAPTSNLCASGTETSVSGTGPWSWQCLGINGGSTASCSANIQTYTVTADAGGTGGGTIISTPAGINYSYQANSIGSANFNHGLNVVLTATANTASTVAWTTCDGTVGGNTTTATCTFNSLNASKTATATFTLKQYTVTAAADTGGSISPTSQTVNHGQTTTFTITPSVGYDIATVSGCGGSLSGNIYSTAVITDNCTVTATFATASTTLNLIKTGTGVGSVIASSGVLSWSGNTATATYPIGLMLTLQAVADNGSSFGNFSGCDSVSGDTCSVIMTENKVVSVSFVDTQAPYLTVNTLPDGAYTNLAVLNINGVALDNVSGLESLKINNQTVSLTAGGNYSYAIQLTLGANQINVTARDNAGNEITNSRTIFFDNNSPVINITAPADNVFTNQSSIVVSGNVNKQSQLRISLNSGAYDNVSLTSELTFSKTLTLQQGVNLIELIATDSASNTATVLRTVTLDTTTPSVAITQPVTDTMTNQSPLLIRGTVFDANLSTISMSVNGSNAKILTVINGQFEEAVTFSSDAQYQIAVTATDLAGNTVTALRNIIFKSTPPTLNIDAFNPITNSDSITISGTKEPSSTITASSATATVSISSEINPIHWSITVAALKAGKNDITIIATDNATNQTQLTTSVYRNTSDVYTLALKSGWNFVTLPLRPSNNEISAIFEQNLNNIVVIWGYDNTLKQWQKFKHSQTNNTLTHLDAGKGYWIYLSNDMTLTVHGHSVDVDFGSLTSGWNLIGHSGEENKDISVLNQIMDRWVIIWTWQSDKWTHLENSRLLIELPEALKPQRAIQSLIKGRAYWIKLK